MSDKIHRSYKPKRAHTYTVTLTLVGAESEYYWSVPVVALSAEAAITAVKGMDKYQQFENPPVSYWVTRSVTSTRK